MIDCLYLQEETTQTSQEELEAAALKIQAVHRGRKTRMEMLREKQEKEELEAAALKIQAVHRGRKTRMDLLKEKQEQEEMEAAALKIQAVHRGKKTRMDLLKEKQEKRSPSEKKVSNSSTEQSSHLTLVFPRFESTPFLFFFGKPSTALSVPRGDSSRKGAERDALQSQHACRSACVERGMRK